MTEHTFPMGAAPFRPLREIQQELERGNLDMASAIAKDYTREYHRPLPLEVALGFLPVVALRHQDRYDTWACRWLARWLTETPHLTAVQAAEMAESLAELTLEPETAFEGIQQLLAEHRTNGAKQGVA